MQMSANLRFAHGHATLVDQIALLDLKPKQLLIADLIGVDDSHFEPPPFGL